MEVRKPDGRGGAIPSLGEIRNSHINVGTGKELTIRELSELVVKVVGFSGMVEFDTSKPDGTMRKLIDVSKLHSLGWSHKVEIAEGVQKLFEWYQESLQNHRWVQEYLFLVVTIYFIRSMCSFFCKLHNLVICL